MDGYASTNQTGLVYSAAYGYDAAERLTSLGYISAAEANLAGYVYTYDADGRVTGETNVGGTVTYAYDADSRLTAATGAGLTAAESYAYDATGNRTDTGDATSSGNRLSSDGTYSYAYDADGNLLTRTTIATGATTTYAWDYRNRLTDVTDRTAGGTVSGHVHYAYDVFDRRIGQQVDGNGDGTYDSTERYVYDGGGSLLLTLSGTGVITHAYLNGPAGSNQVLADDATGSGVTWLLTDRLGSVKDVINSAGTVIDHLQYDSYGNVTAQSNAADQPRFGYAGMQLDPATGLYYDNARYYDAGTGTFISQDPSGFAGGNADLYGYVNNDPTNLVDPSGLSPKGPGGGSGGGGGSGSGNDDGSSWWGDFFDAVDPALAQRLVDMATGTVQAAEDWWQGAVDGATTVATRAYEMGDSNLGATAEATIYAIDHLVGIDKLAEAITGTDLMTGEQLSGYDRVLNAAQGTAQTALSAAGAADAVSDLLSGAAGKLSDLLDSFLAAESEAGGVPASSPAGRSGNPMGVDGANADATIGGRDYGGHALDQMQGRGIPPSAVENAIQNGVESPDPIPGRLQHYDPVNNITVITEGGRVVTVHPGGG